MHRPTQRRDALRERVFAGRLRRDAQQRRAAAARKGGRRMVALFAGLAMVAGVLTVTQLASNALEEDNSGLGAGECETVAPTEEAEEEGEAAEDGAAEEADEAEAGEDAEAAEGSEDAEAAEGTEEAAPDADGDGNVDAATELEAVEVTHADGTTATHWRRPGWRDRPRWGGGRPGRGGGDDDAEESPAPVDDETSAPGECDETTDPGDGDETSDPGDGDETSDPGDGDETSDPGDGDETADPGDDDGEEPIPGDEDGDGELDLLGVSCDDSNLEPHDGFQNEEARCVQASHGEVAALENNASLLFTEFPQELAVAEPFSVTVSTRNLVRDRFLGAAVGGYYAESDFLNEEGIPRGHFHFACVALIDGNVAPTPETLANPQIFQAVEDGGGGAGESSVTLEFADGLPEPGQYRCMVWAGAPSHRTPMMTFARQQTAADMFRVNVQ